MACETLRRCSGERINTETTGLDGVVVEIAVIDAATGEVLLDTLVSPGGVPVEDGARAVHRISDDELAGAPSWADVVPGFLAAVAGRRILAYNASFDYGRVAATMPARALISPNSLQMAGGAA